MRCEKLCFHQALCLGAPNAPVGPSLLDARPKGVASKGKVGESRGAGKPWCPCPFCPPPWARRTPVGGHRQSPPPPGGGNAHAMSWRTSPVPGGPLSPAAAQPPERRYRSPSAEGKERKLLLPQGSKNLPVSREVLNIYVSNRISVFGAALSVQYGCRAAAS